MPPVAFDEALADRIRETLAARADLTERKMFGGIAFMVGGNMACGVIGDDLMVRLDRADAENALAESHVRPMDFTGKPMPGMIYVSHEGCSTTRAVKTWVDRALEFNATLPPKSKPAKRRKPRPRLL